MMKILWRERDKMFFGQSKESKLSKFSQPADYLIF